MISDDGQRGCFGSCEPTAGSRVCGGGLQARVCVHGCPRGLRLGPGRAPPRAAVPQEEEEEGRSRANLCRPVLISGHPRSPLAGLASHRNVRAVIPKAPAFQPP